jgi:hypothetical protein
MTSLTLSLVIDQPPALVEESIRLGEPTAIRTSADNEAAWPQPEEGEASGKLVVPLLGNEGEERFRRSCDLGVEIEQWPMPGPQTEEPGDDGEMEEQPSPYVLLTPDLDSTSSKGEVEDADIERENDAERQRLRTARRERLRAPPAEDAVSARERVSFHSAVCRGDSVWTRDLLARVGAEGRRALCLHAHPGSRWTALHFAASNGHAAVCEVLLLGANAPLRAKAANGAEPLHCAAMNGMVDALRMLLSCGAPPDAATPRAFYTPLHYAAAHGHAAACRLLLESGAAVGPEEMWGRTPEELASERGHILTVRLLRSQTAAVRADSAVKRAVRLKNATKHRLVYKGKLYGGVYPGRKVHGDIGLKGNYIGNY